MFQIMFTPRHAHWRQVQRRKLPATVCPVPMPVGVVGRWRGDREERRRREEPPPPPLSNASAPSPSHTMSNARACEGVGAQGGRWGGGKGVVGKGGTHMGRGERRQVCGGEEWPYFHKETRDAKGRHNKHATPCLHCHHHVTHMPASHIPSLPACRQPSHHPDPLNQT